MKEMQDRGECVVAFTVSVHRAEVCRAEINSDAFIVKMHFVFLQGALQNFHNVPCRAASEIVAPLAGLFVHWHGDCSSEAPVECRSLADAAAAEVHVISMTRGFSVLEAHHRC